MVANKDLLIPRPRNKQDLLKAGEEYYIKLIEMADGMSEKFELIKKSFLLSNK